MPLYQAIQEAGGGSAGAVDHADLGGYDFCAEVRKFVSHIAGRSKIVIQFGMRVECQPTAWQQSITGDEIRTIIALPLLRYAITTIFPMADTFMFIGRVERQPWIEVAAEDVDGEV